MGSTDSRSRCVSPQPTNRTYGYKKTSNAGSADVGQDDARAGSWEPMRVVPPTWENLFENMQAPLQLEDGMIRIRVFKDGEDILEDELKVKNAVTISAQKSSSYLSPKWTT